MSLLIEAEVLKRAARTVSVRKSTALESLTETASAGATFDVFLSHSSNEPTEILLGIKGLLEDEGLSVYVDRYTDTQLDPDNVTKETAETLRIRLRASRSLLYVYSRHSQLSRWMPWELGFMDGAGRHVGVVPVVQNRGEAFDSEQYLGLYPYVDRAAAKFSDTQMLWINGPGGDSVNYPSWVRGTRELGSAR